MFALARRRNRRYVEQSSLRSRSRTSTQASVLPSASVSKSPRRARQSATPVQRSLYGQAELITASTRQQFMRASARHKSWHRVSGLLLAPLCRVRKCQQTGSVTCPQHNHSIIAPGLIRSTCVKAVSDTLYNTCLTFSCRPSLFIFASHFRCQCRATEKGRLESGFRLL
jgi:hypothetical protein